MRLGGWGLLEWFMVSSCVGCGSEKLCLSFLCELLRVWALRWRWKVGDRSFFGRFPQAQSMLWFVVTKI